MDHPVRSFVGWLAEHRRGHFNDELSYAMAELVEACKETGKSGKVVVTVSIAAPYPGADTVALSEDIKLTLPKPARPGSVYYTGPGGALLRDDPAQQSLDDLRSLPQDEGPGRRLDGGGDR